MYADLEIVERYVADVKERLPIDKVFLYGSYAKGNPTEYSDIDVCFFSRSFENLKTVDVVTQLLSIARKYKDVCIEPTAFPFSELNSGNPFVKEILSTGYEL